MRIEKQNKIEKKKERKENGIFKEKQTFRVCERQKDFYFFSIWLLF